MPRKTPYPRPSMRYRNGAWQILWRWNFRQYVISTGLYREREDRIFADVALRQIASALSRDEPDFPSEFAGKASVKRYVGDRFGQTAGDDPTACLDDYEVNIRAECGKMWAAMSVSLLRRFDETTAGGILNTTPRQAADHLDSILEKNSIATRNRNLAVFSRFFKWAIRTGRTKTNPFARIKTLKEPDIEEIVYCSWDERDRIIAMAKASGQSDCLAVPFAFYTAIVFISSSRRVRRRESGS